MKFNSYYKKKKEKEKKRKKWAEIYDDIYAR